MSRWKVGEKVYFFVNNFGWTQPYNLRFFSEPTEGGEVTEIPYQLGKIYLAEFAGSTETGYAFRDTETSLYMRLDDDDLIFPSPLELLARQSGPP